MTTFPARPDCQRARSSAIDPFNPLAERDRVPVQPGHADAHAAGAGGGRRGGDRSEALRLKGAPVETIKLDVEIDATDQLERAERAAPSAGHLPAALGARDAVYPKSALVIANTVLLAAGTIEVIPPDGAVHALRLGPEARPAGAPHRVQHHRGGARPRASTRSGPRSRSACACSATTTCRSPTPATRCSWPTRWSRRRWPRSAASATSRAVAGGDRQACRGEPCSSRPAVLRRSRPRRSRAPTAASSPTCAGASCRSGEDDAAPGRGDASRRASGST